MSSTALPAMTPRHGLRRWFVALVATVLLVVSGSGLVAFAQSDAASGKGPQFVPADAAVYVEVRLDLPAGQGEALAEFMTAFPGFADTGSFELKVGEAVNGLIGEATGGAVSGVDVLASFATGEAGLALMDLAAAATGSTELPMLVGVAISDRAAAEAFVDTLMSSLGADVSEEAYGDARILSSEGTSVGITAEWLLLSQTVDMIKAGVDTIEGVTPSLADDPDFAAAFSRVPAAHLGAAYLDLASFGPLIELAGTAAQGQGGVSLDSAALVAQLPVDMVAYLAAEADRMTLEAFITPSASTPTLPVGESDLALRFPSDTQVYVETRELGDSLESLLSGLLGMMDEASAAQIAPFEDMLGEPLPTFFDFVSDASVGGALSSDGLWLGIAAEVSDEAVASQRLDRGRDRDDRDLRVEEAFGTSLPFAVGDTISVTISDGTLLMGTGEFVTAALKQPAAESLGESAAYTEALSDDTQNSGVIYANVSSLLAALDPMLSMMTPQWADIAPYATAIDRIVAVGSTADDVISVRMSVIVGP